MMEIKLCPHFEIVSRCCFCADRACADCDTWSRMGDLIPQGDGRLICRSCQTKIDRLAAEKAQPDLFVEQKGLFQ